MSPEPKILAFAGSARKQSFNKRVIRVAVDAAREAGAVVTLLDLHDFPLPIFDGDLEAEEGLPPKARELKDLFLAHQGLMIASPEYNSSITPLLKNTIDWVSRPVAGEPALNCFTGKVAVLMAASPGALGGLRALVHVRSILGNIGVILLPEQVAIPKVHEALAPDGSLKNPDQQASIRNLGTRLATFLKELHD